MSLMGYRQYAKYRRSKGLPGGTHRAVQKAVASGRIRVIEKRIDADQADRDWALATDPAMQREAAPEIALPILEGTVEQAPAALSARPVWDVPFPPADPKYRIGTGVVAVSNLVDGNAFMQWRTREQRANALAAERDLAREDGKLLDADEVRATYRQIGRMLAQTRETLPTQLAPELVGLTDPHAIARHIRDRFRAEDLRIVSEIEARFKVDVLDAPVSDGGC